MSTGAICCQPRVWFRPPSAGSGERRRKLGGTEEVTVRTQQDELAIRQDHLGDADEGAVRAVQVREEPMVGALNQSA